MDYKMTPFWNACVEYLPMWMAPNMVTLLGFAIMVVSNLMYIPYDLSLTMEFHPFCYIVSGFVVFVYQTLDAIDGKQARRTGTSSPLGQLFDHGCDAWTTVFTTYMLMQILRSGPTVPFVMYLYLMLSGFYTANWEEYHTHVLRTACNGVGLTECQFIFIGILLAQGFSGGVYSELTMREVGTYLLPLMDEQGVQAKL